jgi:D-3-phosphoglycerate dehydrogenase / 2-oxoglutarate reductase
MKISITTSKFISKNSKTLDQILLNPEISVSYNPYGRKLTEDEILNFCSDSEIIIAGTEPYNKNVLSKLNKLKIISRVGIGTDSIDLNFANSLGIKVLNTATAHVNSVSEYILSTILAISKNLLNYNNQVKSGIWDKKLNFELSGTKIGFIGHGNVTKRFIDLYEKTFNLEIRYFDPYCKEFKNVKKINKINDLIEWSNILIPIVPLNEETKNLLNSENLKYLTNGNIIIHASRGGVINENDLYDYLINNNESIAYIDVFENEPYKGKLLSLDNTFCSPHIAGYSKESRLSMENLALTNAIKFFKNEK